MLQCRKYILDASSTRLGGCIILVAKVILFEPLPHRGGAAHQLQSLPDGQQPPCCVARADRVKIDHDETAAVSAAPPPASADLAAAMLLTNRA